MINKSSLYRNVNTSISQNENENIRANEYNFKEPLLGDRFKLVKILGSGGMSTVYLAENINLGTFWAIKKICKNPGTGLDILIEPNILKKLNHPSLPRIIDIIEDDEYLYIVQDFIEGNPLDKELQKVGKFPIKTIIEWSLQICDVLTYLHEFKPNPIIYRDMKPGNIILTPWGEIKLVDFGIAREYKKDHRNDTVYIGTKGYAAPEQYGDGQSNVTTDIYCFGVTIFHLITGKLPQKLYLGIKLPSHYTDSIPPQLEQIICKCTRFNPEERYNTVRELRDDIIIAKNQLIHDNIANIADINEIDEIDETDEKGDTHKAEIVGEKNSNSFVNITSKLQEIINNGFPKRRSRNRALNYKSMIITVWDNTEFACEIAYVAAKATNLNILFADMDLLSPKADLLLNIKKYPERIIKEGILNESGLNIALDSAEKGILTRESLIGACIKLKKTNNLYILTGNYRLENYEYYNNESLTKFIDKSSQIFDIIILAVNKSIYDSFTTISLIKSDINIIPVSAIVHKFREFNNYIVFLKDKQKIPLNKNKFVAYEYNSKTHLPASIINEVTQHNYLGSIRFCPKREKCRNMQTVYAKKMDKKVVEDYISILHKIKILPDALEGGNEK